MENENGVSLDFKENDKIDGSYDLIYNIHYSRKLVYAAFNEKWLLKWQESNTQTLLIMKDGDKLKKQIGEGETEWLLMDVRKPWVQIVDQVPKEERTSTE